MPELPEVETIARNLRGENPFRSGSGVKERPAPDAPVVGRTIVSADVYWDRTIAAPETGFAERIAGQRIQSVGRRAKYLVLGLDADQLVVHLRMSGDVIVRPAGQPAEVHDRVVFHLSDGRDVAFNDTRKFGRVWLVPETGSLFQKLGPEPFGEDFTPEWLYQNLHRRRRQIKPLLLDQHFLAGVGNIYADESLHRAGIHPLRTSDRVTYEEAAALHRHIRAVLEEGIRSNGASIDWVYRGGGFQNHFRVYDQNGQPCKKCGTIIEKIVVGQRGTHFCPGCQPWPDGFPLEK